MVFGESLQGTESHRRCTDGIRVECAPNIHGFGPPREDSRSDERPTGRTWVWNNDIVSSRSLIFLGAWIRKMVRNLHWQTRQILGPKCREHDNELLRIQSPNISGLRCLWERSLESKGHGKKSIHFNGSDEDIELLLHTEISSNLSCLRCENRSVQETIRIFQGSRETWSTWSFGNDGKFCWPFSCFPHFNEQRRENPLQACEQKIWTTIWQPRSDPNWALDAGLKIVELGLILHSWSWKRTW